MIGNRTVRPTLLAAVVCAGAGLVALSFVPGWLVHTRSVGGHGLTDIVATFNAWQGRAVPVVSAGVVAGGLACALAALRLTRPRLLPGGWAVAAGVAGVALLASALVPLERTAFVSQVEMAAGWPGWAGAGLAAAILVACLALAEPATRHVLLALGSALVLAGGAFGGRVVAVDLAEGDPRHYADGEYVRDAADGLPTTTLTFEGGTIEVGDRWSGELEERGLVVVITGDPACPDVRGSYRVFAAGDGAIRWNAIYDTCADGERERDLSIGIWRRVD